MKRSLEELTQMVEALQDHVYKLEHPWVCVYCDKEFNSQESVMQHEQAKHPDDYEDDNYA